MAAPPWYSIINNNNHCRCILLRVFLVATCVVGGVVTIDHDGSSSISLTSDTSVGNASDHSVFNTNDNSSSIVVNKTKDNIFNFFSIKNLIANSSSDLVSNFSKYQRDNFKRSFELFVKYMNKNVSEQRHANSSFGSFSSIVDKNLTDCLLSSNLMKCLKLSLLQRLTLLLEVSDKIKLNKTMELMDGLVSLEPTTTLDNHVQSIDLKTKMKELNDKYEKTEDRQEKDAILDLLLISGLSRFFNNKELKLHFIPGYTIKLQPAKTYSDYVSLSLKASGESPEQVATRTMKLGGGMGNFMMLGPMITLGMLPFTLASLNYMVMNAYAMNNMALLNVLWTTIKDYVFEDNGQDIVYRNPGYENEHKLKHTPPKPKPPAYQFGKPIVHDGYKTASPMHTHNHLFQHEGPPKPLVHYSKPSHPPPPMVFTKHLKAASMPAGYKLRLVHPSHGPRPKPSVHHFPKPNFQVHHHVPFHGGSKNRPHIVFNSGPKFTNPQSHKVNNNYQSHKGNNNYQSHKVNNNQPPTVPNMDQHSTGENYVDQVNRYKATHTSLNHQSLQNGPQFQENHAHHDEQIFIPTFTSEFLPNGGHQSEIYNPIVVENYSDDDDENLNFASSTYNTEQHTPYSSQSGINSLQDHSESDFNYPVNHQFFPTSDFNPYGASAHDVELLTTSHNEDYLQQHSQNKPVSFGPALFENHAIIPTYLEKITSPDEDSASSQVNDFYQPANHKSSNIDAANVPKSDDKWVPKENENDSENGNQNWPIVYVDPTTGLKDSSNAVQNPDVSIQQSMNYQNFHPEHQESDDDFENSPTTNQEQSYFNPAERQQYTHTIPNPQNVPQNVINPILDRVHMNFGSANPRSTKEISDPKKISMTEPDSVDQDDTSTSNVQAAERLVQIKPIHVPESRNSPATTYTLGPIIVPAHISNNHHTASNIRRSDTTSSDNNGWTTMGIPNDVRVNFETNAWTSPTTPKTTKLTVKNQSQNEWKAGDNPKFENQKRPPAPDNTNNDSKLSKTINFGGGLSGGSIIIQDDNTKGIKDFSKMDANRRSDIIYDDSHDGNWETDSDVVGEIIPVDIFPEERVLFNPNNNNKQNTR